MQFSVTSALHAVARVAAGSSVPSPGGCVSAPSGTKSRRPVVPTRLRIWSAFWMPGISTTIRSLPWTTTCGSATPGLVDAVDDDLAQDREVVARGRLALGR